MLFWVKFETINKTMYYINSTLDKYTNKLSLGIQLNIKYCYIIKILWLKLWQVYKPALIFLIFYMQVMTQIKSFFSETSYNYL